MHQTKSAEGKSFDVKECCTARIPSFASKQPLLHAPELADVVPRSFHGPDFLTAVRPFCGVGVWWALATNRNGVALGCLIIGAVSDLVDGWWARKIQSSTVHGPAWDGLADRLLLYLVAGGLWYAGRLPVLACVLLFLLLAGEAAAAAILRQRTGKRYLYLDHLVPAKCFGANACLLGGALVLNWTWAAVVFAVVQGILLFWVVSAYHFHCKIARA